MWRTIWANTSRIVNVGKTLKVERSHETRLTRIGQVIEHPRSPHVSSPLPARPMPPRGKTTCAQTWSLPRGGACFKTPCTCVIHVAYTLMVGQQDNLYTEFNYSPWL